MQLQTDGLWMQQEGQSPAVLHYLQLPLQSQSPYALAAAIQGRSSATIVRHLVSLSPGVSVVGFGPVPPQSFGSKAALVVLNLACPSPKRTFRPYGFLPLV